MTPILEKCRALREDARMERLFELSCDSGSAEAAVWLEGDQERSVSRDAQRAATTRYAAWLRSAIGAENQGRYVALSMDTRAEWFPTFWGLMQAGYNALLLDATLGDDMTAYLLSQADACAIVSLKRRALPESVRQLDAEALFAAPESCGFVPAWADSVALCTSGTTATSRIFVYQERALVEQVLSSELLYRENKRLVDDRPRRSLAFLPYHHVLGFVAEFLWTGFLGYCHVYLKDRAPQTILATAQRCRVELLIAVPLLANNLCAGLHRQLAQQSRWKRALFSATKTLSLSAQTLAPDAGLWLAQKVLFKRVCMKLLGCDLKALVLGGSHTPGEHLWMLNALGYYTVCGFGMTETAITSVETSMKLYTRVSGSVGKPLSNIEYRIRHGEKAKRRGEMLIRGASIHTGRLVNGRLEPPDLADGGWYATGDIVRMEHSGRMYVQGRCKDVIINESGENVYPDELEDVFSALTGVEQFTVLGVRKPGKRQRYEDIALVVNVGERYKDDAFLEKLLAQARQCNDRLPAYKRLSRVLVTPERLPLVNGIKVKRLALKELIETRKLAYRDLSLSARRASASAPDETLVVEDVKPSDLQMEEIKQKVRAVYAEALTLPESAIGDDALFIDDLGGDSLQVLSLSLKVEELFSVLIPEEEYGRCTTVNNLASLLYGKLNGEGAYEKQGERGAEEEIVPIARFEDAPEYQSFQKRQSALMADGAENPYFVCHDSPLRDKSLMAGQEVLNFGSYNYAGMSGRPEVEAAAKDAIDRYGTSASGSRLLAGEKTLYQELEKELASWKHAQSALVLVGGHSTNVTVVGNFCGKNDLIVYDALAHNSVQQGCRLSQATAKPFPHNDADALESILRLQRARFAKVLIIIEGAYSMDGDVADVPRFVALKKQYGCFLMVDEAHSSCVLGETGGGVDEYFGLAPEDIDIKMGTLSKGLGTCGGYIAGPAAIVDYMRYNLPGFVFSVGISPPLAAATLESIRQLRKNPGIMADLRRNIDCFVAQARKRGLDICLAGHTAIIPVMVGRDEDAFALSNRLRERGVFVPPAVYPAVPKNKARLRFCVISEHRPEQIVEALDKLVETADEMGIALPRKSA